MNTVPGELGMRRRIHNLDDIMVSILFIGMSPYKYLMAARKPVCSVQSGHRLDSSLMIKTCGKMRFRFRFLLARHLFCLPLEVPPLLHVESFAEYTGKSRDSLLGHKV